MRLNISMRSLFCVRNLESNSSLEFGKGHRDTVMQVSSESVSCIAIRFESWRVSFGTTLPDQGGLKGARPSLLISRLVIASMGSRRAKHPR